MSAATLSSYRWPLVLVLSALLLALAAAVCANPLATDNVTARLVAERPAATPGEPLDLALVLDMRPGWHTYWTNPGDSGEPTRIEWRLPEGVRADPIRWPYPELIRVGPLANYGYSAHAVHLIRLQVPPAWPLDRPLELVAEAHWLVCAEYCIPESGELALTVPVAEALAPPDLSMSDVFAFARERLPRTAPGKVALMETSAGALRLAIDTEGELEDVADARFFASEWGLIEHAAAQSWRLEDGRLLLDLVPGPMARRVSPAGVLVVESAAGTSAFELSPEQAIAPMAQRTEQGGSVPLNLPLALVFALLGGIILNLMPCVFPVLAMKALALTRQGEADRRERILHGLAYTAGVLCFFALVGTLLLVLRSGGASLGWGFQLQYPPFVALMAYLFFVLGLSLTGALTIGARLMGLGAKGPTAGAGGAFATGALAALVAAPCTAPFMGAALGYAVTLAGPLALTVVLTLGLGLALPYLVLAVVPGTALFIPKSGQWMENLKQFLAFPMFATAAWLVWVLSVQTGPPGVAAVLGGMIVLALGLWSWERSRFSTGRWRLLGNILATAGLAAGLALGAGTAKFQWAPALGGGRVVSTLAAQPFSPDRLEAARKEAVPVFVNMTAAWCITCLVNEQVALNSPAVADAFAAAKVVYLKGDWTNRDPLITDYLASFGRSGVPIYVYYAVGAEPRVLPQILTESIVLNALEPRKQNL